MHGSAVLNTTEEMAGLFSPKLTYSDNELTDLDCNTFTHAEIYL